MSATHNLAAGVDPEAARPVEGQIVAKGRQKLAVGGETLQMLSDRVQHQHRPVRLDYQIHRLRPLGVRGYCIVAADSPRAQQVAVRVQPHDAPVAAVGHEQVIGARDRPPHRAAR